MSSPLLVLLLTACSRTTPVPQDVDPADGTTTETGTSGATNPTGDTAEAELTPCDTGFPAGPVAPVAESTRWFALGVGEQLGNEVAVVDHDGDGLAEILLGAPHSPHAAGSAGAWLLRDNADEGVVDLAAASWYPSGNQSWSEGIALMPDTTGDGSPEVVVTGRPDNDAYARALVFEASDLGRVGTGQAITRILDSVLLEALGIDDITGDGLAELVLSGDDGVYLFSGVPVGDVSLAAAPVIVEWDWGGQSGRELATADVDGDGILEVLTGGSDLASVGHVTVIDDPSPGTTRATDYAVTLEGEATGSSIRSLAGGDLDGDGYHDVVVGDSTHDCASGRAYLARGPFTGPRLLASADTLVDAVGAHDSLGSATTVGDFDGDGQLDWAIGIPRARSDQPPGRVALFRGPISPGTLDETLADTVLGGQQDGDRFGSTLASGDVDGDGLEDLVVGAPEDGTGGSVSLILGR